MLKARQRWVAAIIGAAILGAAALSYLSATGRPVQYGPRPAAERPELRLLTSLPIIFPEDFTLESKGSPVLSALRERYWIVPISVADRPSLAPRSLLLMIQPRAQPAEMLVELDGWVRAGGRLLLIADPLLRWPSERPLGDILRPPVAFADTGLLGHWGLRLDAPSELGPKAFEVSGQQVRTAAPGELVAVSGDCVVDRSRLVARCTIGKGSATVIADADFLDPDRLGESKQENVQLLLAELERLEHRFASDSVAHRLIHKRKGAEQGQNNPRN